MKNIKKILAVIDDSTVSKEILKKSIELASMFDAGIIVLHTIHIPFFNLPFYNSVQLDKESVKVSINAIFDELNSDAGVEYHTLVYFGDTTQRMIIEANRDDVDLVIGGSNLKFDKFLREVNKSILVVREVSKAYNNILIPTDLSEKSKNAIRFIKNSFSASQFGLVYGYESIAMVTSMYDINTVDMVEYQEQNREMASDALKKFREELDIEGVLINSYFSLPSRLLEYIKEKKPDLVVVASHSGKDELFLGSTSGHIAKESSSDVLIFCQ